MATTTTDEVLVFGPEPVVISRAAVAVARLLHQRGHTLSRDGEWLTVSPGVKDDPIRPAIRRHKEELLVMVDTLVGYHSDSTQ